MSGRWIRPFVGLGLLGVALLAVAAVTWLMPRPSYEPSIAGVVARSEAVDAATTRLVLERGETLLVAPTTQRIVLGSSLPDVGELLLSGSAPEPWVARLVDVGGGCFWIGGRGTEDGDDIRFPVGIVLPKAEVFDRAHYHESEHELNGAGFCVDETGRVTAVR
jgi:hypothetical protein